MTGSSPFSFSLAKTGSNRGTKKMTRMFSTVKPARARNTGYASAPITFAFKSS